MGVAITHFGQSYLRDTEKVDVLLFKYLEVERWKRRGRLVRKPQTLFASHPLTKIDGTGDLPHLFLCILSVAGLGPYLTTGHFRKETEMARVG